jgi:hypothetical protein
MRCLNGILNLNPFPRSVAVVLQPLPEVSPALVAKVGSGVCCCSPTNGLELVGGEEGHWEEFAVVMLVAVEARDSVEVKNEPPSVETVSVLSVLSLLGRAKWCRCNRLIAGVIS